MQYLYVIRRRDKYLKQILAALLHVLVGVGLEHGGRRLLAATAPGARSCTANLWDRCYDFKNIFSEKIGVFDSKQS
jgi:hypothetical protein